MSTSLLAGLFSVFSPPSLKHFTLLTQALIYSPSKLLPQVNPQDRAGGEGEGACRVGRHAISNPRGEPSVRNSILLLCALPTGVSCRVSHRRLWPNTGGEGLGSDHLRPARRHQITDGLPQRMMMIVDCACLTQGVGTIRPPRPAEPEWRGPAPPSPSSGPDVK